MTLREYIVNYRTERDLSQRQFAEKCGLSNSYISLIERGTSNNGNKPITPSLHQIKKLADAMNVSVSDLLTKVDDMPIDIEFDSRTKGFDRRTQRMVEYFSKLNSDGMDKALSDLEDMTALSKYTEKREESKHA